MPVLRTLDLSKNSISKLRGLETIDSLKFLNMSLNNIRKIIQYTGTVENSMNGLVISVCWKLNF